MKLTLLGTGGPRPDPDRHGPATVVHVGDERLLFDCGRGVVMPLARAGIALDAVNPVFVTHHHYDHIVDLADVILSTWLEGRRRPLAIFGPPGTAAIVTALLGQIYDRDVEFRARGEPATGGWKPVEAVDVMAGSVHETPRWRVSAEVVVHGHGLDLSEAFRQRWLCLGYRVEAEGKAVAISGDCIACPGLERLARDADVLVQCCYLARDEIDSPHLERVARYTLACSDTVGQIARKARVRKLVLTHFRRKSPFLMQALAADVAQDYSGPVVLGQDLVDVDV